MKELNNDNKNDNNKKTKKTLGDDHRKECCQSVDRRL